MKSIYLACQDESTRAWTPVAVVTRDSGDYRLRYTRGAEQSSFTGFVRMTDLRREYISNQLFPILANRLLPKSRPQHAEYLNWLGLSAAEHDDFAELSRTGGIKATDPIEIIATPEIGDSGNYEVYFFSRGIRHFPPDVEARVLTLSHGQPLFLMKDFQNKRDPSALLLRTDDPISIVGYAPSYYTTDIAKVAGDHTTCVTVERVNPNAPVQYRLLCKLSAPWPEAFAPFGSDVFKPLDTSGRTITDVVGSEAVARN